MSHELLNRTLELNSLVARLVKVKPYYTDLLKIRCSIKSTANLQQIRLILIK